MSLSYGDLTKHCVQMLEGFRDGEKAMDSYLDNYIVHLRNFRPLEDVDETFLREVFAGIVRYQGVLEIVVESFYQSDGRNALKSDSNVYSLLTYLALFRLDELTMLHFRRLATAAASAAKLLRFFAFFLAEENLQTYIRDEWTRQYDSAFVQTELISPLQGWMSDLQAWLGHLDRKLKPTSASEREKKFTKVKPFNITEPRARAIPAPEPLPKLSSFSRPLPKSLYEEPKERSSLAAAKAANKKKAEARLKEAKEKPPRAAAATKSKKTLERERTIIQEEEKKLKFDGHRAKPAPDASKQKHPVKLTTAAILREGLVFRKQEEEILRNLEKLEQGYKDDSSYYENQKRLREEELKRDLAEVERKHLAGLISYEESILAKKRAQDKNAGLAAEMKAEAKRLFVEMLREKEKRDRELERIFEGVAAGHERARDSKKKLTEYNRKMAQSVNEESRELMRQALEEAEEEMRRRMALIHEIRVMESRPADANQKLVDLAETAGHGFLNEMSIAELRERLALLEADSKKEEEKRRDAIVAEKREKERSLNLTLEKIQRHRSVQTLANAAKLENKREKHGERAESEEAGVAALRELWEEKRRERIKAKQETTLLPTRESNVKLKAMAKEKKRLHDERWRDLEEANERTTRQVRTKGETKDSRGEISYAQLIFASEC